MRSTDNPQATLAKLQREDCRELFEPYSIARAEAFEGRLQFRRRPGLVDPARRVFELDIMDLSGVSRTFAAEVESDVDEFVAYQTVGALLVDNGRALDRDSGHALRPASIIPLSSQDASLPMMIAPTVEGGTVRDGTPP